MTIRKWYKENFDNRLQGRYVTLSTISPILNSFDEGVEISIAGHSELGREIPLLKIGTGINKILIWSQMHGNESTTTKALFDLIKFLTDKNHFKDDTEDFLMKNTLYILPILNPDGAALYTRSNANGVDLNRDAQLLSQKESRVLRSVFDSVKPQLCLNMHDQRTIFGLDNKKPATVSFLAPAVDVERTITSSRQVAMQQIVKMNNFLQTLIPGQVGRFDDSFNAACVGDTFQMKKVPTILFEAGHYPGDYDREKTREIIFYALLSLFDFVTTGDVLNTWQAYSDIPENRKNFRDIVLRNVVFENRQKAVDIAIQYTEKLRGNSIEFEPRIDTFGSLSRLHGHRDIDVNYKVIAGKAKKMLINGRVIHKIHNKQGGFSIYFNRNVF